jgi:16S rRNA (guanine966-N2)-methyltransferase
VAGAGGNRFRIIAGQHRGRRLRFPDVPGLRPSPDRVRETLFNWLGPAVRDARCLDLFAGSGALGLEALSRGAAFVTFVDRSTAAIAAIDGHLTALGAGAGAATLVATAEQALARQAHPCDIVFLDPPFADNALERLCTLLAERGVVRPGGLVYLEHAVDAPPALPADFEPWRRSRAGRVAFQLVRAGASGRGEGDDA